MRLGDFAKEKYRRIKSCCDDSYHPVVESNFNPTLFLLREERCQTKIECRAIYIRSICTQLTTLLSFLIFHSNEKNIDFTSTILRQSNHHKLWVGHLRHFIIECMYFLSRRYKLNTKSLLKGTSEHIVMECIYLWNPSTLLWVYMAL